MNSSASPGVKVHIYYSLLAETTTIAFGESGKSNGVCWTVRERVHSLANDYGLPRETFLRWNHGNKLYEIKDLVGTETGQKLVQEMDKVIFSRHPRLLEST
jgi:hypothetical protein